MLNWLRTNRDSGAAVGTPAVGQLRFTNRDRRRMAATNQSQSPPCRSRPCSNPSIRPNASVDPRRQSARDNEAHGTAELEALDLDFGVQGDAWDPVKQMLNSHSYGAPTEPSTEADVGTG